MIIQMNLNPSPFEFIKSGQKTIEMRLYDEKRRLININDIIEFTNNKTKEKITCRVIGLHVYDSFKRLYELFDKTLLGYLPNEDAHYLDMEVYYKDEDIKKYGVVGIEIEVIKTLDVDVYYQQNLDL